MPTTLDDLVTKLRIALVSPEYTQVDDMYFKVLAGLGYTGTLGDTKRKYAKDLNIPVSTLDSHIAANGV